MVSSVRVVARTALAKDLAPNGGSCRRSSRAFEWKTHGTRAWPVPCPPQERDVVTDRRVPPSGIDCPPKNSAMAAAVRLLLFRGIRMRGPLGVGDWCQLIGCSCPRTCVRRGRRATRGCPPRAIHASPVKTGETTVPRSRSRGTAGRLFVQACTEGGMHACPGGCCRRPQLPLSV